MGSFERLVLSLAVRCYGVQLHVFPRSFRQLYGPEMLSAFGDLARDTWSRAGLPALVDLLYRSVIDSVRVAVLEHRLVLVARRESRRAGVRGGRVSLFFGIGHDTRYAIRGFVRQPGYTFAAATTLALGIGANSAIFSVVHGVLMRPLPYQRDDALVELQQTSDGNPRGFSVWELQQYRAERETFDAVVEYHSLNFNLLGHGEPEMVRSGVVSWQFFDVLGVEPIVGRLFTPEDDRLDSDAVLVLSFEYWRRTFHGDPNVVGQTVRMNDRSHEIIGVLPPMPHYPRNNDVYMPTVACPFRSSERWTENPTVRGLDLFARLQPEVRLARADTALAAVGGRLRREHPEHFRTLENPAVSATSLKEAMTLRARPTLLLLMGAVGFVLLIACANVASLTAARQMGREKEMAVRTAIGAGRARLARLLITESVLLATFGGILGVGMASLGMNVLVAFVGEFTPRASEVRIDGAVLAFTLLVSLITGVGFGLLPMLSSRRSVSGALADGRRQSISTHVSSRLRSALSVGQLGVSFVLLVGAGLSARSFVTLATVESGVLESRVLNVTMSVPFDFDGDIGIFHYDLLNRLRKIPGVLDAAIASAVPMSTEAYLMRGAFQIDGRDTTAQRRVADVRFVSPGYFSTIGQPILKGRAFGESDTEATTPVIVVSESLARRHFGATSAVGETLVLSNGWRATIVGVVGDVRQLPDQDVIDELYVSTVQDPGGYRNVLVRTAGDPTVVARSVGNEIHALQPDVAVVGANTLKELRADAVASPRIMALLMVCFALVALLITAAGISGVIGFAVRQRRNELGIRMALGAPKGAVLWMVLRQGVVLIAAGVSLGAIGAFSMKAAMRPLVYGIEASDPMTFAVGLTLIGGVAIAATYLPARRATSIDPAEALRGD